MNIPKIENINSGTIIEKYIKEHYPEFYSYIINHYPINLKWTEKLYWYYHNINDYPKCPICGNKLKYLNFIKGYRIFCSDKCAHKSEYIKESREKTMIKKYGVKNSFQLNETLEKRKQTWKEKYGYENPIQNKEIVEKRKQTWKEKYDVENIFQSNDFKEKRKQTLLQEYGVETPMESEKIKEKYKQTCIERYGFESPMQNKDIQTKQKQTNLEKYGVEYTFQSPIIQEKRKQTNLEKYGFEVATQSPEIQHKRYLTNKKNHSFNSSKIEEDFAYWLTENNITFKRQYKSEKYPFACDFYFPDKDLYLEIQGNWTHGSHPYDPNNQGDQEVVNFWKSKGTEFYDNAIRVWTEADPLKRKVAKENGLNWVEVFSCKLDDVITLYKTS